MKKNMSHFPAGFRIGPVDIAPATVLAPMAGVTDTVFRRLIRNQGGCGLIMTEFTSSHGVVKGAGARKPSRTMKYLAFQPEEPPKKDPPKKGSPCKWSVHCLKTS